MKLRIILKNMFSEKWRIILNVLAIAIAGSIIYIAFVISDTLTDSYISIAKNTNGCSDIHISNDKPYISLRGGLMTDGYEKVVEEIQVKGVYRNDALTYWYNVHCLNQEDIKTISDVHILKDLNDFSGNKVIIGQAMADYFGISVDDEIELSIKGNKESFVVYDIAGKNGFFSDEVETEAVIIPLSKAWELLGTTNTVTDTYVFLNNSQNIDKCLEAIKEKYPEFDCNKTVDKDEIAENYSLYSQVLMIIAVIVLFLSIYIVYANFKIISYDRIDFLGCIRSMGANRLKSLQFILIESVITGIVGGILGNVFGVLFQYILQINLLGFNMGISVKVLAMLLVLFMTVSISILGSLKPIISANKLSLARIVKGEREEDKKSMNLPCFVIGCVLVVSALCILNRTYVSDAKLAFGMICMLTGIILAMNTAISLLIKLLSFVLIKLIGKRAKKILLLLSGDSEYSGIIRFCSSCAAVILMMISVASGIKNLSKEAYEVYNSEIVLSSDGINDEFLNELKRVDGVDKIYATYEFWNISVDNGTAEIQMMDSAGSALHNEFFNYEGKTEISNYYEELSKKNNIIISKTLARKLGKEIGDIVSLDFKNNSVKFTIIDIIDYNVNKGMYAVISQENFLENEPREEYDRVYIKTSQDPDTVIKRINKYFEYNDLWILSTEQRLEESMNSLNQIFTVIYVFIFICTFVGGIGIINSMEMSFNRRKKEWGILVSIGMSRSEIRFCFYTEVVFVGFISGVLGGMIGILLLQVIPAIFDVINYPMIHFTVSPLYIVIEIIFVMAVIFIPAIANVIKLKKLNIVENLKEN